MRNSGKLKSLRQSYKCVTKASFVPLIVLSASSNFLRFHDAPSPEVDDGLLAIFFEIGF